jgi:hypothetical protein
LALFILSSTFINSVLAFLEVVLSLLSGFQVTDFIGVEFEGFPRLGSEGSKL